MNPILVHLSILALEVAFGIALFLWFENAVARAKHFMNEGKKMVEQGQRLIDQIMRAEP